MNTERLLSPNPLQIVLDNMPAKVYVCDVETYEVMYANKAARVSPSFPMAAVRFGQILPPLIHSGLGSCSEEACCWEYHDVEQGAWWQVNNSLIKWDDERRGHLVIISELTEQKRLECALIDAHKRAEEALQQKSVFIANMSHELRTPLNAIVGFLDLLYREELEVDEPMKKDFVDIITNNAAQLLKLIGDFLDISKMEAGQMTLSPVEGNLNSLMRSIYLSFSASPALRRDSVDFRLDIPDGEDSSEYLLDYSRLQQILENLIGNALKFTEKGYVRFGYSVTSDCLQFFVADTGIGIAKDKLANLGKPFNQLHDSSLSAKYGGTGMGLAISKNLVELMHGTFRVQSELGRGTTFLFSIPLA